MVRGVNKNVIEIFETESGYFERAILFVNPQHSHLSQKRLYAEAQKYVDVIKNEIPDKHTVISDKKNNEALLKGRLKTVTILSAALATAVIVLLAILNIL